MKNIIEKFYYGEVIPCEKSSPDTKKFKETSEQLENVEDELLHKFPDIKNRLEEYRDLMHILTSLECANDFCDGFRLGALFMFDILNIEGKEKP